MLTVWTLKFVHCRTKYFKIIISDTETFLSKIYAV